MEETKNKATEVKEEKETAKPKKPKTNKAVQEAEQKAAEAKEQLLRTLAEYDNYRKRTQREKEGMYADGIISAVKAFLPVIDNLERALSAAQNEEGALKDGVQMVMDQVNACLTGMGVTPVGEKGEEFDPNKHMAVMHVEDAELGENVVKEVLQKGYIYKEEQLIRNATVVVAN